MAHVPLLGPTSNGPSSAQPVAGQRQSSVGGAKSKDEDHDIPAIQTAVLPPGKRKTADEVLAEMKRIPLFMTSLDDMDEDNDQLNAIRALAYEGTRAEVAENFKSHGNDLVKTKHWSDAREFYTKALHALKNPSHPQPVEDGLPDVKVMEIDEEAERRREVSIEEACYANRALCHLEMRNYGSCNKDCAAALRLNPKNMKAWYRAASACLALDKIPEALDACQNGLSYEPQHPALQTLLQKTEKRREHLEAVDLQRRQREERTRLEKATLRYALKTRNIFARETEAMPNLEDAAIALADPLNASSTLSLPTMLLYPLHAQSDFIKGFAEHETLKQHLAYILPPPWDDAHEYTVQSVDCYMETSASGLIKAGKNLSLLKLLAGGKIEVLDSLVKVNVVPKAKAAVWIEEFKRRRGRQ